MVTTELLDALPMAVVLVDRASRISGWNAAAETLYGYPRAVAAGASFLELLFDEDDRDSAAALVAAAARGRPWRATSGFAAKTAPCWSARSGWRRPAPGRRRPGWATDGLDQGLAEQERSVLLSAERAARRPPRRRWGWWRPS